MWLELSLEEGIEFLLGVVAGGGASAGAQDGAGGEVIAVVASFFVADPFGLVFGALVMFAGVVELAIATGMEVGVALGARVAVTDATAAGVLNLRTAFPAVELHRNSEK